MRIGVFCYNFKHWKTQAGLQNLFLAGYQPSLALAADPVDLKFYKSKVRITPKDLFLVHPADICEKYKVDYKVVKHNSQETCALVKEHDLDLGIVLGARILDQEVIQSFNLGVLNMHPGILPDNRGLDNIKWSLIKNLPIGVTCNLIDDKIDRGRLVAREQINVYEDDSLLDLHLRVQNLEQKMMIDSIGILSQADVKELEELTSGSYYRSVPWELERDISLYFEEYKKVNIKK